MGRVVKEKRREESRENQPLLLRCAFAVAAVAAAVACVCVCETLSHPLLVLLLRLRLLYCLGKREREHQGLVGVNLC